MTRNKSKWMTACAAAMLAAFGTTGASAQQISEARIKELIKQAADQVGPSATLQPVPQTGAATTQPVVRLTLDEAVKFALDRNLDIAVQRLNPEIQDIAYASAEAVYHPTLTSIFSDSSTASTNSSQTNQAAGGGIPKTDTINYNGGIAQSIPWGGGSFTAQLNNNRSFTNINNITCNPCFQPLWTGTYIQPLLRNFNIDSTRQTLAVTKISRDISDIQLRATITNTLSNVRNAYWDYVFAVQAVEVAQQSLSLAAKLVQDNQTRVEVGTMAPIDVVSAQSEAATRKQALVQAQATQRTTELALKRFIVSGTQDPNWNATIDPVDRPDFRPEPVDIDSAVRRALSERTDVAIARKNVEANDVTLKYLGDQMKPQADLQAVYGIAGLGGDLLTRSSGELGAPITTTNVTGITGAYSTLFRQNYPRWTVQLNLSYPLGLSAQKASVARARVQVNQIQAQLKQVELQVATDVTNAAIGVQNNAEAVQAAGAARELAQKKLEAAQSKFDVGISTNFEVVQAQRDLADAQNTELRNILNYRKALVEIERVQQTTLGSLGISLIGR
jgi:outer membrane protein